jgi:hypothetical protein
MSILSKKKKKLATVSGKDKLGKIKKKNKLEVSSSKTKKKKRKKLKEQEADLLKKKKKKVVVIDEDDLEPDDDDEDPAEVLDTEEGVDESDSDDEVAEQEPTNDLSAVDPGPEIEEVECGFNCGSCTKFVKLDDAIRKDPEWITTQISKKSRSRCPFLFPEEMEVPDSKSVSDLVVRADSKACDHFAFNEDRASEHLTVALDVIRAKLTKDEIDIVSHSVDRIRGLKSEESKYGYQLGEQMRLQFGEHVIKCEVVEFQRKKGAEVIVRPLSKVKGVPNRLQISARKAVAVS